MKKVIKGRPLSKCIGKAFYSVHKDIQSGRHTYYDLTGGRGSLKSSFVLSFLIILIISSTLFSNRFIKPQEIVIIYNYSTFYCVGQGVFCIFSDVENFRQNR